MLCIINSAQWHLLQDISPRLPSEISSKFNSYPILPDARIKTKEGYNTWHTTEEIHFSADTLVLAEEGPNSHSGGGLASFPKR